LAPDPGGEDDIFKGTHISIYTRRYASSGTNGLQTYIHSDARTYFDFYFKIKWLRHYATSRKVAGSRPDEVNF
jgi:hypothetical protein